MKFKLNNLVTLCVFLLPFISNAQAETLFNNIRFDESVAKVEIKLKDIATQKNKVVLYEPTFPLAQKQETHLIYNNINTQHGTIESLVLTFADDKLCYIEAIGNAVTCLKKDRKEEPRTYLQYEAYFSELVIMDPVKDKVWLLTKESAHPNLFTWDNPYLDQNYVAPKIDNDEIPSFIKMGASITKLEPIFKSNSLFTNSEELDGSDPNAQIQINCFGVNYLGFPRKIEARFGNEKLNTVWILTGKGEEDRIRQALIKNYGTPIFVNEAWEIFDNWKIGLRKDKPEILLLTQELGLFYKKEFFKQ